MITELSDEGLETLRSNKRKIDGSVFVVARVVAFEEIQPSLRSLLAGKVT